jgi:hypothetical protein
MSHNTFAHSVDDTSSLEHPRAFETILYGGLAVGILDGLYAVIASSLRGGAPIRVFQYISSGLLGRESFNGGLKTALLGILLHFLIAFILAAIYYGASLALPMLIRQALIWGPIFGVAVHLVMRLVVTPLSAASKLPFSVSGLLSALLVHILFVGLPIALLARHSAKAGGAKEEN